MTAGLACARSCRASHTSAISAACSLVTQGKRFPARSMIMGSPAKVVRQLTEAQIEGLRRSAQHYRDNAQRFKKGLRHIG